LEPDTSDLPQRLKAATRELHARAERSGVMAQLLKGHISAGAYVAMLRNLQAIYEAVEVALRVQGHEPLLETLARSAALAADLRAFAARSPAPARCPPFAPLPPTVALAPASPVATPALAPATLAYVARLQALQHTGAHRLWAHVYVRYLGDLHGGQILSRIVQERFAVPGSTHFYEFGDAQQVQALRTALRTRLATLSLDAQQANETVDEAVWAFEAHCQLFDQIER
jgi:heme oxygenase (biliverdin-producing, ferredoxin)